MVASALIPLLPTSGPILNVANPRWAGAAFDAVKAHDGSIAAGQATFYSANLASAKIGQIISISGAGTDPTHGVGAPLYTTITSIGTGSVTVADAATTTVSGVCFTYGTDDSAAWQAAINTGLPVIFDNGATIITTAPTYTGTVSIYGFGQNCIIYGDTIILNITYGSNSVVGNFRTESLTAPWIITRDPSSFDIVPTITLSDGLGYQPTSNDTDLPYSNLTSWQKNQDIGPKIIFQGNASNISVSQIYGKFVSIMLYDATNSCIDFCDIQGGKNFGAGILFWNINNQIGYSNKSRYNNVIYASFSGIAYARNTDLIDMGNNIENCGESGIKTFQGTFGSTSAICYRASISNSTVKYSFFDGIDATSTTYMSPGTVNTGHIIQSAKVFQCNGLGIGMDSNINTVRDIYIEGCGAAGVYALGTVNGEYTEIRSIDCNKKGNSSTNQIGITGTGNRISTIRCDITGMIPPGYGLYAPDQTVDNVLSTSLPNFFGNPGSITANLCRVMDSKGQPAPQSFTFAISNVGGTLCHFTFSNGGAASNPGYRSGKVIGSSAAQTTTPTGSDATTSMAGGYKIGSANPNYIWMNTSDQLPENANCISVVTGNTTGTPLMVDIQFESININGTTKIRPHFNFARQSDGSNFPLNTTSIPAGKAIFVRFYGELS